MSRVRVIDPTANQAAPQAAPQSSKTRKLWILAVGSSPDLLGWKRWLDLPARTRRGPDGVAEYDRLFRLLRNAHEYTALAELMVARLEAERDVPSRLAVARAFVDAAEAAGGEQVARLLREHIDLLQCRIAITPSATQRADLYRSIAALWEGGCNTPSKAAECYEWIAAETHSEDAHRELERLYEAGGHWRKAIDVYCRHARIVTRCRRQPLLARIAEIYETELGDVGEALRYYREAIAAAGAPRRG
jgi:tetratricopeptide (TPR) repeat protein